jgi:hypothetical protein
LALSSKFYLKCEAEYPRKKTFVLLLSTLVSTHWAHVLKALGNASFVSSLS